VNFIDLFAGGGGLSEGFIRAGFKAIAHVEMDEAACYTLKTRIASRYLKRHHQYEKYVSYLKGDISRKELYKLIPDGELGSVIHRKITPHTIGSIFREIDGLNGSGRVDVIVNRTQGPVLLRLGMELRMMSGTTYTGCTRGF